jgi:collagen type XXII alpha
MPPPGVLGPPVPGAPPGVDGPLGPGVEGPPGPGVDGPPAPPVLPPLPGGTVSPGPP